MQCAVCKVAGIMYNLGNDLMLRRCNLACWLLRVMSMYGAQERECGVGDLRGSCRVVAGNLFITDTQHAYI